MTKKLLIFICVLISFSAKASFDFDPTCVNAYKDVMKLKLGSANSLIYQAKKANPKNSIPVVLENYIDYLSILTNGSKAQYVKLKANKEPRIALISKDDKLSPYYLYSLSEIYMQWAILEARFQDNAFAEADISKAFSMLQENEKKFPAFLPGEKNLGVINVLLGTQPYGIKRQNATTVKGDVNAGVTMLTNLVKTLPGSPYSQYYDEVTYYLAFIQNDIVADVDTTGYINTLKNTQPIDSINQLRAYVRGYVAIKNHQNAQAIVSLMEHPNTDRFTPMPAIDYLLGKANLQRQEKSAPTYLLNFLKAYNGVNNIKDAYLRLAWNSLIKGDSTSYRDYMRSVKTKGFTYSDVDRQALNEANEAAPDVELLTARLYAEGGFYSKALDILNKRKVEDFKLQRDRLQYSYLMGQIFEDIKRPDLALRFYQFAINMGWSSSYNFASYSALRLGKLYEDRKNYSQAKTFYKVALTMKHANLDATIESKAQDALKRLPVK